MQSLTYERADDGFDLVASIDVFKFDSQAGADGYYKLKNHILVTLRSVDCEAVCLEGFNRQNVLFELVVEAAEEPAVRPVHVVLQTSYGLEGDLYGRAVKVVEAVPCDIRDGQ